MRLGIFSDIHCNIAGFRKGLELIGRVDEIWCAGDSVFQYRWSNDVVALLRELDARVVLGNHEDTILGRDGVRAIAAPTVDPGLVEWMRAQPYRREGEVDGKQLLMIHGSPWEPWDEYHYPHESIWERAGDLGCDVLIVGHTHFQMGKKYGRCLVINPGSAGDARDPNNEDQLSCAVYDTTIDEVTFYDYQDPARVAAAATRQAAVPR